MASFIRAFKRERVFRIGVQFFDVGSDSIFLEVCDLSGPPSDPVTSAVALMNPKEARKLGRALIKAAKTAA
jgi:hypothetical protein